MEISPKRVKEYKKIYKKEFGEDITDAEAAEQGRNLVEFFRLLMEIDQENKRKERNTKKK